VWLLTETARAKIRLQIFFRANGNERESLSTFLLFAVSGSYNECQPQKWPGCTPEAQWRQVLGAGLYQTLNAVCLPGCVLRARSAFSRTRRPFLPAISRFAARTACRL